MENPNKTASVSAVRETSAPAAQAAILQKAYPEQTKNNDLGAKAWAFHVWIGDIGLHFFGEKDEQVSLVVDQADAGKLQIRDSSSKDPLLQKLFRSLNVNVIQEEDE